MLKNKATKLAVLSLLGILGLTSCGAASDPIYAKPDNYEDPIVQIEGQDKIHNNVLKIIYDAIHEGSLSSKVLDKSLYNFAESVFGVYNSLTRAEANTEVTLKAAISDYDFVTKTWTSTEKVNEFIKLHKAYWTRNDDGKHINDDDPNNVVEYEEDADFTPCDSERDAVIGKWNAIEKRIAENMYARALSGTYTEKHLFKEEKFIKALHEDGKKVDYYTAVDDKIAPVFVPYTVEKDEIFDRDPITGLAYVNREYYQSSADVAGDTYGEVAARFIEDEVIPEVYSDLLIEQYLLDENVQAIRNTRARKINVLKIEKHTSSLNADALKKALVDEIYNLDQMYHDDGTGTFVPYENIRFDSEEIENDGRTLFEKYSTIAKGLYDEIQANPDALAIVNALNAGASDVYAVDSYLDSNGDEWFYYNNTKYADLIKEYKKVDEAETWDDLDDSLYSSYTSSGTTTIQEGLEQKTLDIKQQANITKGWFIENKSASLDSNGKINERLYKLSVANAKIEVGDGTNAELVESNKAELSALDRFELKDNAWQLREDWGNENSFLCSINGAFYLKFEGQYTGEDRRNDIVYDDGSAYYVVQVLEASKDSKLRNEAGSPFASYSATRGKAFLNETIDEVAKILGETGNYASTSKDYWLKKMDFKFHDQEVYDYFKENYPDLFK